MFLQSESDKWLLKETKNIENMFQSFASTCFGQKIKGVYKAYQIEVDPNGPHIDCREYGSSLS